MNNRQVWVYKKRYIITNNKELPKNKIKTNDPTEIGRLLTQNVRRYAKVMKHKKMISSLKIKEIQITLRKNVIFAKCISSNTYY